MATKHTSTVAGAAAPTNDNGSTSWRHLETRPAPWKRGRLYVKGHRLRPVDVWHYLGGPVSHSVEEAMDNWDLPREAIDECVRYCDSHLDEIESESAEERRVLQS